PQPPARLPRRRGRDVPASRPRTEGALTMIKNTVTKTLLVAGCLLLMASTKPAAKLSDGAPSADALISRFFDALERRDQPALRALRVTEREYLAVILPGSVEKKQPRRKWPEEVSRYFWSEIDS